jgi:hypothetical protein
MARPRIADDFAAIRARMEELRGERAQASDEDDIGLIARAHRRRISGSPAKIAEEALQRAVARALSR